MDDGSRWARAKRRRARELRSAWLYLALALAVASITGGGFLAGFEHFAAAESAVYGGGWLLAWAMLFRFPRSLGIPVLLLALAVSLTFPLVGEPWHVLRGEEYVARVRILSVGDGRIAAEWRSAAPGFISEQDTMFEVDGSSLAAGVRVVGIPEGAFFLAADALIRIETVHGDTPENDADAASEPGRREEVQGGIAGRVSEYLVSGRIPRFESRLETARIRRPVVLSEYRLHASAGGQVSFVSGRRVNSN